jgi:hypothetical protein
MNEQERLALFLMSLGFIALVVVWLMHKLGAQHRFSWWTGIFTFGGSLFLVGALRG